MGKVRYTYSIKSHMHTGGHTMKEKIEALRELMRMKEELEAEITALQDEIKAVMTAENVDTLRGTDYKVTWKAYQTSRIDSKALKADLPEIAAKYTKTTTARRFLIA